MPEVLALLALLIYLCATARAGALKYIFPPASFEQHETPVYFANDTDLRAERQYYGTMREISLFHSIASCLGTAGLIAAFPPAAAYTAAWWGYNTYVLYKSSHIVRLCDSYLATNRPDRKWARRVDLIALVPSWLLEPAAFALLCAATVIAVVRRGAPRTALQWAMLAAAVVGVVYVYSIVQILKESADQMSIRRDQTVRELMVRCSVERMSFGRRAWKFVTRLFDLSTDKYGYLIDPECQALERSLAEIDLSLIEAVYRGVTRSFIRIVRDIWGSLNRSSIALLCFMLIVFVVFVRVNRVPPRGGWDGTVEVKGAP